MRTASIICFRLIDFIDVKFAHCSAKVVWLIMIRSLWFPRFSIGRAKLIICYFLSFSFIVTIESIIIWLLNLLIRIICVLLTKKVRLRMIVRKFIDLTEISANKWRWLNWTCVIFHVWIIGFNVMKIMVAIFWIRFMISDRISWGILLYYWFDIHWLHKSKLYCCFIIILCVFYDIV